MGDYLHHGPISWIFLWTIHPSCSSQSCHSWWSQHFFLFSLFLSSTAKLPILPWNVALTDMPHIHAFSSSVWQLLPFPSTVVKWLMATSTGLPVVIWGDGRHGKGVVGSPPCKWPEFADSSMTLLSPPELEMRCAGCHFDVPTNPKWCSIIS